MDEIDERRSPETHRVTVSTLVEICGNEPGIPAFEAESVDVSGQGMHLRTTFVPDVGDPLVCRFENAGGEIVVEGVVAWRQEDAEGGEFGVKFTALDSGSVEALASLCSSGAAGSQRDGELTEDSDPAGVEGAKVRLYIDGLAAPMKARIRGAQGGRVKVGSNLEFLRVGRRLDIEDIARTERRGAFIDTVNVAIDPSTRVPQLIVTLRYEGVEESTPEPSVIDFEQSTDPPAAQRAAIAFRADGAGVRVSSAADSEAREAAAADEETAAELDSRFGNVTASALGLARSTSAWLSRHGTGALNGVGAIVRGSGGKLSALVKRGAKVPIRRTTAPPPSGPVSLASGRLRPQSDGGKRAAAAPTTFPVSAVRFRPGRRTIASASAAALILVIAIIAFSGSTDPPGAAPAASAGSQIGSQVAAAASPSASANTGEAPRNAPQTNDGVVVADVPLFGPTPMATMEPAPLGPPPDAEASRASGDEDVESREKAEAIRSLAQDESFDDPPPKPKTTGAKGQSNAQPSDVKPWGRGRMHMPTIHRLRLDAAGAALAGTATSTGFSVNLAGRKVMESAAAIQRRDRRIARVKIKNSGTGAAVSFVFRGEVPSYRVRLRKDFVEFLISAPDKSR